ncbi:MAG TPA: DMT family transporter [Candidatus Limnocylindrales bacterium]|nr:DMT family transporter [Candidatus Limnocylindrales bacterium]
MIRTPSLARPRAGGAVALRAGVALAFGAAAISGVSVFINAFAVRQLPDPAIYTTLKNAVAATILIALAAVTLRPGEIGAVGRRQWLWLAVIGVVGGSVPFLLFFTGLAQASAPSAAFIQKTLFIWVALLAVPLLGERLGWAQLASLGVLLAGQALVLSPANVRWGSGETMIAAATLLWAVETILVRRVLRTVPTQIVAAARLGFGMVVLVAYLGATGRVSAIASLSLVQWAWALGTGVLLAAYVATWFGALRRAPASLVTAVLVVGAPVTATLQAISTGGLPAAGPLAGNGLLLGGALLLAGLALVSGIRRRIPIGERA